MAQKNFHNRFLRGLTYLGDAIGRAHQAFRTGRRPDSKMIMLILTDGLPTDLLDVYSSAIRRDYPELKTFAIIIGDYLTAADVYQIKQNLAPILPDPKDNYMKESTFASLINLRQEIIDSLSHI